MAEKLPWFPLYACDFINSPRVSKLTNEQRGIYFWLLCRQWMDGSLPFDIHEVYHLFPIGSESPAIAYVLTTFFPPDPDTNLRRNPRLEEIRLEQERLRDSRKAGAAKTNKGKGLRVHAQRPLSDPLSADSQSQSQKQRTTTSIPEGDFTTRCVVLVNQLHPQTGLEGYRNPLQASKARSVVQGWLDAGIPETTILGAITAVCERLPKEQHISSLRYFDRAVREAHTKPEGLPDALFAGLK